jgi:hypothetical protein
MRWLNANREQSWTGQPQVGIPASNHGPAHLAPHAPHHLHVRLAHEHCAAASVCQWRSQGCPHDEWHHLVGLVLTEWEDGSGSSAAAAAASAGSHVDVLGGAWYGSDMPEDDTAEGDGGATWPLLCVAASAPCSDLFLSTSSSRAMRAETWCEGGRPDLARVTEKAEGMVARSCEVRRTTSPSSTCGASSLPFCRCVNVGGWSGCIQLHPSAHQLPYGMAAHVC